MSGKENWERLRPWPVYLLAAVVPISMAAVSISKLVLFLFALVALGMGLFHRERQAPLSLLRTPSTVLVMLAVLAASLAYTTAPYPEGLVDIGKYGMPVFSTSLTIDPRADAVENLDLESVRFMEMPWFVQPDHPAVMAYAKPAEPMPIDYERLYALGIDAWRLAQLVAGADVPGNIPPLDGVTGRITLEGHQFVRMLASGEMRDGRPVLYKPAE